MADEAEDLSLELHNVVRRRVLRRLLRSDGRISRVYREAAGRIRTRLRALSLTEEQVAHVLAEELGAVEEALLPEVERELERAAQAGDEAARRTLERLGPAEGGRPFASAPVSRAQQTRSLRLLPGSGGSSPETD